MTYLKLDSGRLLSVIDGLNHLLGNMQDPESTAELGARLAGQLVGASGAWVRSGHEGLPGLAGSGEEPGSDDLTVPLESSGEEVGQLVMVAGRDGSFDEADHEAVRLFAPGLAARLLESLEYERANLESRTDAATGLGNENAFTERLEWELTRASRYGEDLSVAIFELEDLPAVLDRFGAKETDKILTEVGEVLSRGRASDSCFRIESDTFTVVMPNTDREGAEIAAIRMAWQIAAVHGGGAVTAITGVAQAEVPDPKELVSAVRTALRISKTSDA